MGDIADMMIDGTLCEGCGVFLGWSTGHPEYCHSCKEDGGFLVPVGKKKAPCPDCGKWVWSYEKAQGEL